MRAINGDWQRRNPKEWSDTHNMRKGEVSHDLVGPLYTLFGHICSHTLGWTLAESRFTGMELSQGSPGARGASPQPREQAGAWGWRMRRRDIRDGFGGNLCCRTWKVPCVLKAVRLPCCESDCLRSLCSQWAYFSRGKQITEKTFVNIASS